MTPISIPQVLLAVILLQQSLFGVFWLAAARLRLARRPALHWAAMACLSAGGLALILLRGQVPAWLSVGLGNGLMLAAFVALRRGVQCFVRCPRTDREHGLVLGLGALSGLALAVSDHAALPAVLLICATMAWTLLRGAAEIRGALAAEFGRQEAVWCALPMALLAGLLLVRAGVALLSPVQFQSYLQQPGGGGVVAALVAVLIALLLQGKLIALVLWRLVRRLQYQSDHDTLTGLLVRRPMERRLLAESQRQRRLGGSFALLSIDVDHFKRINDRWGHAAGDAVLQRLAQGLRAAARDLDSLARMGGEEFCVLLPGADAAGADRVAQRLLETARGLRHPETGGAPVTISIGLAVALPDAAGAAEPLQALQRRLDQALYRAKAAGRDRVERAAGGPGPALCAAVA